MTNKTKAYEVRFQFSFVYADSPRDAVVKALAETEDEEWDCGDDGVKVWPSEACSCQCVTVWTIK